MAKITDYMCHDELVAKVNMLLGVVTHQAVTIKQQDIDKADLRHVAKLAEDTADDLRNQLTQRAYAVSRDEVRRLYKIYELADSEIREAIYATLSVQNKIGAIKIFKKALNVCLKDAKNCIELFMM